MSHISNSAHEYMTAIMATHLLIEAIISIGCGLQTDLISAWKSGKNPSAKSETTKRMMPTISVFFSSFLAASGSQYLNMMMPAVTSTPTIIFLVPKCNFLSLTREQSTPTSITERMLQLLNIITTGKLVRQIAYVQVNVEMATVTAQSAAFPAGMLVRSYFLIWKLFTISPIIQVMAQGKIKNPEGQVKTSYWPVEELWYLDFSIDSWMTPVARQVMQMPRNPVTNWQQRVGSTNQLSFISKLMNQIQKEIIQSLKKSYQFMNQRFT